MRINESGTIIGRYTTRLQKGGALLDALRQLTLVWDGTDSGEGYSVREVAGVPSRERARDIVQRAFIPRLVASSPPNLWRVAAAVERSGADRSVVLPIHYYATASSEPLLWDFVVKQLFPLAGTEREVSTQTVLRFFDSQPNETFGGHRWTPTVAVKVARGVLAALRDYGVLRGASKKRVAGMFLPVPAFALLARIRYELGYRGEAAINDDVWKLFFLGTAGVERFLTEAAANHLLRFETAGPVVRIEFPQATLEGYTEYATQQSTGRSRG